MTEVRATTRKKNLQLSTTVMTMHNNTTSKKQSRKQKIKNAKTGITQEGMIAIKRGGYFRMELKLVVS